MVVSLDELDCFDLLIWLRTGATAASRLITSQSNVSRSVQRVSRLFGVSLFKSHGEWSVQGDQTLLNLERLVHQEYRWRKDRPLRIEAQYYSGPLFFDPAPAGWMAGNFDLLDIHAPLHHLRTGVIDAWIGCFPDVPDDDDPDLITFHLTRFPAHLVVGADHPLLEKGMDLNLEDVRQFSLLALPDGHLPKIQAALEKLGPWDLRMNSCRYSCDRWEGIIDSHPVVGYATALTMPLFKAPPFILPLDISLEVGDSLIVRRDYANHPRLLKLLQHLLSRAEYLAKEYQEVRVFGA